MLTEKINLNPTKSHLLLPFQNEMCNTHTNHLPFYSILIFQIFALILYWSPYFFTLKNHYHRTPSSPSQNPIHQPILLTVHFYRSLHEKARLDFSASASASLLNLFIYYFFALKVELNCTVQFLSLPTILYGQVHV